MADDDVRALMSTPDASAARGAGHRLSRPRARRAALLCATGLAAWAAFAFWNSVKPLPAGLHVTSLSTRLGDGQVGFIDDHLEPGATLRHELDAVRRAEHTIVLDQCPLASVLALQLLARKRQRPNVKILLVTDPRNEVYGGTPAQSLRALEAAGIIVVRTRLERLRDSNPLYSSLWRLGMGWWSDSFDEVPGEETLISALRQRNAKADRRQLLVADDGAGGWISIIMSTAIRGGADPAGDVGLEVHGRLARDIAVSELQIAAWSTDDDRLPAAPPASGNGVGTIDARFLTEGAIRAALREVIGSAGSGDTVSIVVAGFDDRRLVDSVAQAAARGARVRLLLDPRQPETRAAAGELVHEGGGNVEVRWQTAAGRTDARIALIQHRADTWVTLGSANFTRRGLDDLDLEAAVELHLPTHAAPARAASALFARVWANAAAYADHADESQGTYWRYRFAQATGLSMF